MKFKLSFTWSYDPLGIIYKLKVEQKTTPYAHTPRPEIEQYMNQEEWQENTLQEVGEQVFISTTAQTPTPREKHAKRARERISPLVLEIQQSKFIMYKKKKNNPLEEPSQEESSQEYITLVLSGSYAATFPRVEEIFSCSHVSLVTQDPLKSIQTRELAHTTSKHSIFARYREIKKKNEALKATTYLEFWKQTLASQHRLLSALNTQKRQFKMALLEPKVPFLKFAADYKEFVFAFDTKQIHHIDQIDLQTS